MQTRKWPEECKNPRALINSSDKRSGLVLAEYVLSALTWAVLTVDFIVELNCYVKQRTWLVRFPILFVFAGEIAKLR